MMEQRWSAFALNKKADLIRPLNTPEGITDRLRWVAFAELQAREAFLWASSFFSISEKVKTLWIHLSQQEDRHFQWLMKRMQDLSIEVKARQVSLQLWESLTQCQSAEQFAYFMASAEERGQQAGFKFYQQLKNDDPITAHLFKKIADEETSHIQSAYQLFPKKRIDTEKSHF